MPMFHTRDRTRLAYTLEGPSDGRAAVLCDGIACDGFVWRYLKPDLLAAGYEVLHFHYRGHGRSGLPRDPEAVTIPHLAGDIDQLMAHVGMDSGVFLGHSMGVQVILETAFRYPQRVRAGVLLCGSYGRVFDTFKNTDAGARLLPKIRSFVTRYREPLSTAVATVLPTRLSYEVALLTELNRERVRREDVMPYLEHIGRMPLDLFLAMLTDAAERTSEPFLRRLQQPMLAVAGEHDGFTPAATSYFMRDTLPHAELFMLYDGTHAAPIEQPQTLDPRVLEFLESRDAPRGPAPGDPPPSVLERWRQARDA